MSYNEIHSTPWAGVGGLVRCVLRERMSNGRRILTAGRRVELRRFPTTRWSSIYRAAGDCDGMAIQRFLLNYLPAMQTYLLLNHRLDPDTADDILQDFVAEKVLEKNVLEQSDATRGKFRTFLLAVLDNFVRSHKRRRGRAQAPTVSLDHVSPIASNGNVDTFEVAWARQVIAQAIERMKDACQREGRGRVWRVFECRILLPLLEHRAPMPYDQLVREAGFTSILQAANALVTAKRMFERTLREVVGEYSCNELEIDEEIRDLKVILAS